MTEEATVVLPDGEYAVIEVLGHRTYVGRVEEVERFGTKLLSIEPLFRGKLLPALLVSGGSIYQFTPCDKATAARRSPQREYELPASLRAVLPPDALPAPSDLPSFLTGDDEDELGDQF